MSDDNNKYRYIGYRPNIKYEDDYNTDRGDYQATVDSQQQDQIYDNIDPSINKIENDIKKIDSLLDVLPSKLKNNILEVYTPLKDTFNKYLKDQIITQYKKGTRFIDNTTSDSNYGLYLNKNALSIKKGKTIKLKAYVVPTSDSSNIVREWTSTNDSIASVDDTGTIYANSVGTVIIEAISTYEKSDTCIVTVLDTEDNNNNNNDDNKDKSDDDKLIIPDDKDNNKDNEPDNDNDNKNDNDFIVHVSEVSLDRTNIIVKVGNTKRLVATIYPSNAENKTLIWSSTANNIATVSNGLVTGVSIGKCMITVSSQDGNKTDTCTVTVINDNTNKTPNDNEYNDSDDDKNPGINPNPDYDNPDDMPIPDDPPVIVIPDDDEPTPAIIEIEFIKNLSDLTGYYFTSLKDMLYKFYKNLLTSISDKNLNQMMFILNNINISNNDIVSSYGHLLDTCLKNEILSDVRMDFQSSNFNFNQTLFHLKGFLVAYNLRKKYEEESYVNNSDIESSISNGILKASKIDYSKKYDKSYENLYRYLNSSLKISDSIIDNLIQNLITKGVLTKKGGI